MLQIAKQKGCAGMQFHKFLSGNKKEAVLKQQPRETEQAKAAQEPDSEEINPPLPPELAPYVPNIDSIEITSWGTADSSAGKHRNDIDGEGAYIRYECAYEMQNRVFSHSFHPFIEKTSNETIACAEKLRGYIMHKTRCFSITKDSLSVSFFFYGNASYHETKDFIRYQQNEQESSHDGGNYFATEWVIYRTSNIDPPEILLHESHKGKIYMPLCKGYWEKDGHCYLVDPWGMPGIFEFYFYSQRGPGYFDPEITTETIGVDYNENDHVKNV